MGNIVLLKMNLHSKPRYGIDCQDTDSIESVMPKLLCVLW